MCARARGLQLDVFGTGISSLRYHHDDYAYRMCVWLRCQLRLIPPPWFQMKFRSTRPANAWQRSSLRFTACRNCPLLKWRFVSRCYVTHLVLLTSRLFFLWSHCQYWCDVTPCMTQISWLAQTDTHTDAQTHTDKQSHTEECLILHAAKYSGITPSRD